MYQTFTNINNIEYTYTSSQPGYNLDGLTYSEFVLPVTHALHSVVAVFYEGYRRSAPLSIPMIPDGCCDMVFSFKENERLGISLCGTVTTYSQMIVKDADFFFGIRFQPGMCPFWREFDGIHNIVNTQQPITGYPHENFADSLRNASDFQKRVYLAYNYIASLCEQTLSGHDYDYSKIEIVSNAMQIIQNRQGILTVDELSRQLFYSPRYIQSVFPRFTGFTPKQMMQTIRAHQATVTMLNGQLRHTEIAMNYGYADLSHMNRDIKNILNIPTATLNPRDFYSSKLEQAPIVYTF